MKKIILIASLILFTGSFIKAQNNPAFNTGFASQTLIESGFVLNTSYSDTPVNNHDLYLVKSKNQKTTAWVLLSGGVALMSTALLIGNRQNSSFDEAGTGAVIGGIGVLAAIGSIPLFISSSKNMSRAQLSVSSQKTAEGIPGNISRKITGLTLSIPMGK